MKTKSARRRTRRRGMITALVAIALVALLAIVALLVDGGRLLDARRQAKGAADAAARSAAIEMLDMKSGVNTSATLSTIRASAFRVAAENGYSNDGTNSIVTVNIPPLSGQYVGKDGYIEVIIEAKQQRGFSRLMGSDPISVVGRSVGVGTFIPTNGSVLVLNPKKKNALALGKGTSKLKVDGDVAVNSKGKKAITIANGSQIDAENVTISGSLTKKELNGLRKSITGELQTNVPATADPFSDLKIPSPGVDRKLSDYKTSVNGADTFNLQPGRYTEEWKFDNNDVVNLAPGTYYLDDKKIDFKNSASLRGDGVTIYSRGKKEIKFQSSGEIHLSPPTSGDYAGISIFKDPTAKSKITFKKNGDLDITGAIYGKSSLVRFQHSSAELGDEDDESIWDDLSADLDDALAGEETQSSGEFGGNIVADMLKIDKHSTVVIKGANLNLLRPILGLVE